MFEVCGYFHSVAFWVSIAAVCRVGLHPLTGQARKNNSSYLARSLFGIHLHRAVQNTQHLCTVVELVVQAPPSMGFSMLCDDPWRSHGLVPNKWGNSYHRRPASLSPQGPSGKKSEGTYLHRPYLQTALHSQVR